MLTALLDWFEEHKLGIIGTLTMHTGLLFALTFAHLRTTPNEDQVSDMRVDVLNEMEVEEAIERIERAELGLPEKVTNLTSNTTAEIKPNFSQARLAESVESELREMERAEFERLEQERRDRGEEIEMPELDPSKWDKERYLQRPAEPVRVEGAALVEHDLKDRVRGEGKPGYLCKDHGRVVIRVEVGRDGRVRKAEYDAAQSSNVDECMLEQALRSTRETPFSSNASSPDPQKGLITFRFVQQ
jgi:hypothetical protein